ncbi:MAG: aminopeptidase P family protein, partial [Thermoleophilia bacterium]|nr:aminopeptidase P family protein [Thermoleophilia bacterium]
AADCRYLTGFTGEAASVLVTPEEVVLVTDPRFTTQAAEEVKATRVVVAENDRDELLPGLLQESGGDDGVVGIEAEHLTVKRWQNLEAALTQVPGLTWRLVDGLVAERRQVKEPDELDALRQAGCLATQALEFLQTIPVVGRSEQEVALDVEVFLRRAGSEGVPFPFIVAAGARGALPHGAASRNQIAPGQMVVFDLGAVVAGYASDITRTFATGKKTAGRVKGYS